MDATLSDDRRSFQDGAVSVEDRSRNIQPGAARVAHGPAPEGKQAPVQEPSPRTPVASPPSSRRQSGLKKKLIVVALLVAALGGAGRYGWHWWSVGRFQESTDNAFLQADKVIVSPRISGFIKTVSVADNQPVHAGDVLATIDDRDARIAIASAKAELDKSHAQLEAVQAGVEQQKAAVAASQADVATAEAALSFATQEAKRYADLFASGAGTTQRAQQTDADLRQRRAALDRSRAALDTAQKQVKTSQAQVAASRADVDAAQAKLEQAQLNLAYTVITAPVDGVVGDRAVRVGQMVQPGTGLLTVVPMGRDIYLVANFKETQLARMTAGQPVEFTIDAFGGHTFHGVLDGFSPGTGAQFALLPPENATGNFTKIVQRVPVRIRLEGDDPLLPRLRPGLSVEATVETRSGERSADLRTLLAGLSARFGLPETH